MLGNPVDSSGMQLTGSSFDGFSEATIVNRINGLAVVGRCLHSRVGSV